jgi:hypothetical protein
MRGGQAATSRRKMRGLSSVFDRMTATGRGVSCFFFLWVATFVITGSIYYSE